MVNAVKETSIVKISEYGGNEAIGQNVVCKVARKLCSSSNMRYTVSHIH